MLFERIVCGVDGSPASLEALRQAATIRPPDGRLAAVIVSDASVHEEAETTREAALLEIGDLPWAETQIVEGPPIPSLLAIAGRERASLLAVGTHGGGRVAGILLGSVATAMLHDAPCPVLIARPAREESWYPRSIVVGVDGSPQSLQAAKTASALAERFGASLRSLAAEGGRPLDIEGLSTIDELEWDRRQPVSALVYASKKADLVILGGRGLAGVGALGSVSERVAHRAHCSVLVVRPVTRYANGSRAAQA
jgi:nucleotide-binding universal stress UspA family protein